MSNTFYEVLTHIQTKYNNNSYKKVSTQQPASSPYFSKILEHAKYDNLLKQAKDVLPSSEVYYNFKKIADTSFADGNLDVVKRTVETFESLKANETSPNYAQQLDFLTKDPFFSNFANILTQMAPENNVGVPTFSGTETFNQQLNDELPPSKQDENSLIETKTEEPLEKPEAPDFIGKTILPDYADESKVIAPFTEDFNPSDIISQKMVNSITNSYDKVVNDPNSTQEDFNVLDKTLNIVQEGQGFDPETPLKEQLTQPSEELEGNAQNDSEIQGDAQQVAEEALEVADEIQRRIFEVQEQVA